MAAKKSTPNGYVLLEHPVLIGYKEFGKAAFLAGMKEIARELREPSDTAHSASARPTDSPLDHVINRRRILRYIFCRLPPSVPIRERVRRSRQVVSVLSLAVVSVQDGSSLKRANEITRAKARRRNQWASVLEDSLNTAGLASAELDSFAGLHPSFSSILTKKAKDHGIAAPGDVAATILAALAETAEVFRDPVPIPPKTAVNTALPESELDHLINSMIADLLPARPSAIGAALRAWTSPCGRWKNRATAAKS